MPPFKSLLRAAVFGGLALLAAPLGYAGFFYATGNVHEVEAGAFYRSAQLDAPSLKALVAEKGIRTVLNLRGDHPGLDWYRDEAAVARDAGIVYRSVSLSARFEPDMATMVEIARILRDSPRPILVHCKGGADRSGLVSAMNELVVEGANEAQAADQLSILYGHMPWLGSRTAAMDRAFSKFAQYWRDEQRTLVAAGEE